MRKTAPPKLPAPLQAITLGTDDAPAEVCFNRAQLARLLGVSELTVLQWWKEDKLGTDYYDGDGRPVIAWHDLAAALRQVLSTNLYERLRGSPLRGAKPAYAAGRTK